MLGRRSRELDDEFNIDRVSSTEDDVHAEDGFRRAASNPEKVISQWDGWHKTMMLHWCGFLLKRGRGPVATWNKRLFELRQPLWKKTSTSPILVYFSKGTKKDVVLRVKDVKQNSCRPLIIALDVVISSSETEVDRPIRRMVITIPEEAMSTHFYMKLLMMLEAGRRILSELRDGVRHG